MRNFLYTVQAQPDFTLDGRFVHQAEEIADAIENKAVHLSEKMVLGYGNHVITSIDAGASLVQEDYLSANYVSTTDKFSVKALAGLNFFEKLKFDIDSKAAQETSDSLSYQATSPTSWWGTLLPGHHSAEIAGEHHEQPGRHRPVVALHYFLNWLTLPDPPEPTVGKLSLFVSEAIHRHYTINTCPAASTQTPQTSTSKPMWKTTAARVRPNLPEPGSDEPRHRLLLMS